MTTARRFLSAPLAQLLANGVPVVVRVMASLANVGLALRLGPGTAAWVAAALGVAQFLSALSRAGLDPAATRSFVAQPAPAGDPSISPAGSQIESWALRSSIRASLVFALAAFVVSVTVPAVDHRWGLALVSGAFASPLCTFTVMRAAEMRAGGMVIAAGWLQAAIPQLMVMSGLFALNVGAAGYLPLEAVVPMAYLISAIITRWATHRRIRFRGEPISSAFLRPFLINSTFNIASSTLPSVVSLLALNASDADTVAVAMRIGALPTLVLVAATNYYANKLVRSDDPGKIIDTWKSSARISAILSLFVGFATFFTVLVYTELETSTISILLPCASLLLIGQTIASATGPVGYAMVGLHLDHELGQIGVAAWLVLAVGLGTAFTPNGAILLCAFVATSVSLQNLACTIVVSARSHQMAL